MGANTEAAPSVGSILNRGGKRAWGGELWLCAETSQTTWGLIEIISPAFSFSKAVSMIEVTFSCDYCYYCHTDCSGQGLKVTCGLRMLGCNGRGWVDPWLGMPLPTRFSLPFFLRAQEAGNWPSLDAAASPVLQEGVMISSSLYPFLRFSSLIESASPSSVAAACPVSHGWENLTCLCRGAHILWASISCWEIVKGRDCNLPGFSVAYIGLFRPC